MTHRKLVKTLFSMGIIGIVMHGMAHADDGFDYNAKYGSLFVHGWTDGSQISCGVDNGPDIHEVGYFGFYEQVYDLNLPAPASPTTYWGFDLTTKLPPGTRATVSFSNNGSNLEKFPRVIQSTANDAPISIIHTETTDCIDNQNCVNSPENKLLEKTFLEANLTGIVEMKATSDAETIASRMSGLKGIKKALDRCLAVLRPKLDPPLP
ncbi:hypothetical protein [Komagataeibacter sp. SM21]|uniref:hypothetical protein n=1 Tax=Komagataeibacter sp. SM21 TaxID=3242899 RepID=UPI0035289B0A